MCAAADTGHSHGVRFRKTVRERVRLSERKRERKRERERERAREREKERNTLGEHEIRMYVQCSCAHLLV